MTIDAACPLCQTPFEIAYVADNSAGQTSIYCGGCHSQVLIEELAA